MNSGCAVIIFAKAPVPGYAKTRLSPALGCEGAARLAERMLTETVATAVAAKVGPVELCCAPSTVHPAFSRATQTYPIALSLQGNGDLGARMQRALSRALRRHGRVLLIGTDAPDLKPQDLQDAARSLADHPAVFAPASDGGYVLVGTSTRMTPLAILFDGIAWSTPQVMRETRARLALAGVDYAELPTFFDVDTPEDLIHVPKEWLD